MNFQRPFRLAFAAVIAVIASTMTAQAPPSHLGPITAINVGGITITDSKTNTPITVSVPATAKVLVVAPGSTDLKSATPGSLADVAIGDKALVTGTAGDTGDSLTAVRVILMKATASAQSHQAEEAAWTQGVGGIVKSVDPGTVVISSGGKSITVSATPHTIVRHYSGDSVRFEDAVLSKLSDIKPGDQVRVRGAKSADGTAIAADEIVTGSFHNYSGLIASIDGTAKTITLKDLATKKTVDVSITANSDIHRLPPQMATAIAARMKGTAASAAAPGAGSTATPGAARPGGAYGGQRAGADLSQMLSRLPTETLGGLKVGDAVMIVATSPVADSSKSNAVTVLAGVDPILTAAPTGEMTLSPWSVGSGAPDMGGGPQ